MAQGQFGGEVFSANRVGLLGFLGQGSPTNKCQDPHQMGAGWNCWAPGLQSVLEFRSRAGVHCPTACMSLGGEFSSESDRRGTTAG
jgi:hypothetical protein